MHNSRFCREFGAGQAWTSASILTDSKPKMDFVELVRNKLAAKYIRGREMLDEISKDTGESARHPWLRSKILRTPCREVRGCDCLPGRARYTSGASPEQHGHRFELDGPDIQRLVKCELHTEIRLCLDECLRRDALRGKLAMLALLMLTSWRRYSVRECESSSEARL